MDGWHIKNSFIFLDNGGCNTTEKGLKNINHMPAVKLTAAFVAFIWCCVWHEIILITLCLRNIPLLCL